MIRFVKYCIIILLFFIGYNFIVYQLQITDSSLVKTKWKNSGEVIVNGELCSDIYVLVKEDMPERHRKWSVEYYYGDVVLKVYQSNQAFWCRYSSKGYYSE